MCHRGQTATKSNTKGGRKKKKEALLIKQLVVHSSDLKKTKKTKNHLHLSKRMTSNNVQQKHSRKLFTLKQTKKKDHSFQSKTAVHSILQQNSNNHVSIKDEFLFTIGRKNIS